MSQAPYAEDVFVLMELCREYLERPSEIGLEWVEWQAARLLGVTRAPVADVLWILVGSDLAGYQIQAGQLAGAASLAYRRLAEIHEAILTARPTNERTNV